MKETWRELYPFESNWLEHGTAKMHYVDEGQGSPILMVHGNPTWSFYYRDLVKAFSSNHRCVVPDHIGCGLSDKPQDYAYTLAQRIDDLVALIEKLDLTDITLVVHDWGGAIGMGAAVRLPDRFKQFVVFNTAAFLSDRIPFSIDICRIPVFGQLAVRGLNGFVEVAQFRAIFDRSKMSGPVRDGYVAPYNSWANRVAVHEFVRDIPMKPSHPTYATLKTVDEGIGQFENHPMLIVWGDDDFCFNPEFREEWQRRFPQAEVHAMKDASHYVVEDKTEEIIGWMGDFLQN